MNAAARALHQGTFISTLSMVRLKKLKFSPQLLITLGLLLVIVFSALGVITLSDKNRIAVGDISTLIQTKSHLQTQYGQLLLEKNTWNSPARISTIAQKDLHLTQPTPQQVIIIHS